MTRKAIIRFLILKSIGNFLVLFSLFGIFATFGPALYFEVRFQVEQARGVYYTIADSKHAPLDWQTTQSQGLPSLFGFTADKHQVLIPQSTNFTLLIPKIGANAKVFANVDPSREENYLPILKQGVAHAKGSALPDENGTVYMFAHSTDNFWDVGLYNAIFYLLKDLQRGDAVTIFYKDKRYDYTVTNSIITDPNDIGYLTQSRATDRQVVLQTCWPPGTTWKRLLVIAKPK
ncbi:MAG TPA: sortase [Patescibacteria group bacterium]|nr:sortase [Patescibacteria group bacterium]